MRELRAVSEVIGSSSSVRLRLRSRGAQQFARYAAQVNLTHDALSGEVPLRVDGRHLPRAEGGRAEGLALGGSVEDVRGRRDHVQRDQPGAVGDGDESSAAGERGGERAVSGEYPAGRWGRVEEIGQLRCTCARRSRDLLREQIF
jgi:hypothetical protein